MKVFALTLALLLCCSIANELRIVPIPKQVKKGNSSFDSFNFDIIKFNFKAPQLENIFTLKAEKFRELIQKREKQLSYFDSFGQELFLARLPKIKNKKANKNTNTLIVNVKLNSTETSYTSYSNFAIDEAYSIRINSNFSQVDFECQGYVSFVRALETFMQVITQGFKKTHFSFDFLPIFIDDVPDYGHRGVMIDTSRHFIKLDTLYTTIRGLSIAKFNVLHLHLTDSESFSFQLDDYSEITQYGSYSPQEIYSQNDLRKLDLYAQKYGIILIPEIDSPAHTKSWSSPPGFEKINSCNDYPKKDWADYCNEPPCGQLDVTNQDALDIAQSIMIQTSQIFSSNYLHLGGDEPNALCWDSTPEIKTFMDDNNIADYKALQAYYRDFQGGVITNNNLNKTPLFWLDSSNIGIQTDENAIFQFWGDLDEYSSLEQIQNPVVFSTYTFLYLDCGFGSLIGGKSWCDPYKTWKTIYSFDVTANNAITKERNLGSELVLWTELSKTDDYIEKIFPRSVGLAMNLWNSADTLGELELVKHLVQVSVSLNLSGILTGAISSEYCEIHIDECFFDN